MGEYISPIPPEQGGQTPQQLNAELISIFELLPKVNYVDEGFALEREGVATPGSDTLSYVRERRRNSEYGKMIMDRVAGLVARANITEHFRTFITDTFAGWMEAGTDWSTDTDTTYANLAERNFLFLDRSPPESGGIFDPRRAAMLEQITLAQKVQEAIAEQEAAVEVDSLLQKRHPEKKDDLVRLEEQSRKEFEQVWKDLEEWREQIKLHYGETDLATAD